MDKIIGLFVTVFVGIPMMVVALLISWWMDNERMDKGQYDDDSDVRYYIPSRCRRRGSNNRSNSKMEGDKR